MKIEMRDPALLKPYGNNAKKHPPEQVEAIAKSIREFGFDQPIVVDPEGVIIKGHGRQRAALLLKLPLVPVIVSAGSPTDQLNRLLDNKLTSREWDSDMLRKDLLDLQAAGQLDTSLFDTSMIPDTATLTAKGQMSGFTLLTSHTCPSCAYKW